MYGYNHFPQAIVPILPLFFLWSVLWKGLALWHSGRRGQVWWFVIFLVVNTLGILEIIYLFAVAKLKFEQLFSSGKKAQEAKSKTISDQSNISPENSDS